ncbi:MAG TPA: PLP-dependent aminotransferase family protein [Myxococcaceae bacterium]|nr:PLP-dependent aminotransferase family protein [Myxococcaceae bacterium]
MAGMAVEQIARSKYNLALRMSRMTASAVREILKVTERPEIVSFAGGLPAPETFPVEALARAHAEVFAHDSAAALQYSTTEGHRPLREWIAARMRCRGIDAVADRVLITSGSQQGIDLVSRIFLDPGDAVVVENPCYLAALQTFGGFQARLIPVGSDDHGMCVDQVERVLKKERPKLIYVVSDFHNPKGTSLSLERREQLLGLSRRYGVPILEDDAYGELRYRGEEIPPIASMDGDGSVIYLSTFSKTISPGVRIGWVVASEEVIAALTVAKQASDLHTSTLMQHAVARMLVNFDYPGHLNRLRAIYGARCEAMLNALESYFPPTASWTHPEGGLFIWAELPKGVNGDDLLREALAEQVAFVPGTSFFAHRPQENFIRLNFSNRPREMIDEGLRRLGRVLKDRSGVKFKHRL